MVLQFFSYRNLSPSNDRMRDMNKKSLTLLVVLVFSAGFFSACVKGNSTTDSMNSTGLEQKNQDISLSGTISKNGELYFITDSAGAIHDVETYSVDFELYVGKQVTVTGQYSGNTLYVTEISE